MRLTCLAPGSVAFRVTQHPSNLADTVFAVDLLDVARRDAAAGLLGDDEVMVGARGDLWKMGDDEHVVPLGDFRESRADLRTHLAADALVHLIEHQRRDGIVLGEDHLEREHQARQLAAGGDLREQFRLQSGVELHLELHAFSPQPRDRFVFINGRKYVEGDRLVEGPLLVAIQPTGAVLTHAGRRFILVQE